MRLRSGAAIELVVNSLRAAFVTSAYWLAFGLLVAVGIVSYANSAALIKVNRTQLEFRDLQNSIQEVFSEVQDAETGKRGYLLTGKDSYLEPYRAATKAIDVSIEQVENLVGVVPGQRSRVDALRGLIALKLAELDEAIELRRDHGFQSALHLVQTDVGKELMDEIRGIVASLNRYVEQRFSENVRRTASLSTQTVVWGILGNLSGAALFFAVLRRQIRERKRSEALARDLARSMETSRIQALAQSRAEIEALGQQSRDLAEFVQTLQEQTLLESDREIEALGQQARELATSVENSRVKTLAQSRAEIETLGQQSRDLAGSVRTLQEQTLLKSDREIEALGQQARELATSVEKSRIQTLDQSDRKIEAMGQQARELATSMETSRIQTLDQSDRKIESLGQEARVLATSVESLRKKILGQSDKEIRKLNQELEQRVLERTLQLEAANTELEAFSYSVSHDLRAPLRAIDGFSRILLEDFAASLAPEGKEYLNLVRNSTRQMGQLVDDLLAFSRLGRQTLAKYTVEPEKIVRRCLEEMAKEQEGRQVEIVIGDLPACSADPTLLKQVWTNLLANALKYTRKREATRIEIGCRSQPRPSANGQPSSPANSRPEMVYFVKDNGAGFNMKYAHKLFGVFQRLHRAVDYEGTGVGLAIVQRIVERHGGRIWGDGIVHQGATFSFTLE
jgi:signal transduction histidine kinase